MNAGSVGDRTDPGESASAAAAGICEYARKRIFCGVFRDELPAKIVYQIL
jgi:hypothetical protein